MFRTFKECIFYMYENPYKKLREDFEFLPNGYRLSQKQLAKEFQDDTKAYYCSTLKYEAIRKIETDKRNVSDFEMKAYRLGCILPKEETPNCSLDFRGVLCFFGCYASKSNES